MNKAGIISFFLVILLGVSGCATTGQGQSQTAGTMIGGVLGGVLGSQVGKGKGRTAAIIIGTLVGASIGGAVGQSMDDVDRMKTARSLESVRTGVPTTWSNPDSGNEYTVTPTRTYEEESGPCREYTLDAKIGGSKEQVYGTACRQPDGSWKTQ